MSRRKPESKRRKKTRVQLAKSYAKTTRRRSDTTHKASKWLVDLAAVLCIETLNAKLDHQKHALTTGKHCATSPDGDRTEVRKNKAPTTTDVESEKWYVRSTPKKGPRSKDTYMRERFNEKTTQVDQMIETALWYGHIGTGTFNHADIGDNPKGTINTLSETAGEWIVHRLMEKWTEEGGTPCTESEADKIWGPQAKTHAKRWIERQAPASYWDAIVRAIRTAKPNIRDNGTMTMKRLVKLATRGPELATKLRSCDAWVAREACWNLHEHILDEDAQTWPIKAVQNWQSADKANQVSDDDAQRGIEHWRWPTMRPPLTAISAGAGWLPPIRSDSAWANAMNKSRDMRWNIRGSIAECRKGEEDEARKAMIKVVERAHAYIAGKPKKATTPIIERCKHEWKNSNELKGNGLIEEPRIEVVEIGLATEMMWVFDIRGPEALLAGCEFEDKTIEEARTIFDMNRIALALTIAKTSCYGKLFERKPGLQKTRTNRWKALRNIAQWTSR